MTIQMINHASVLIESAGVRLLTDPWLYGPAFNEGWDLLTPTPFGLELFETITHIWFSHEHPDHFAPRVLKDIPKTTREKITVLFQFTHDKKIVRFCRGLGFNVIEAKENRFYDLGSDFKAKIGRVGLMDSWIYIVSEGKTILNLNDSVVDGVGKSAVIARATGPVDVLLTQYSYANWVGNEDAVEERKKNAREKLGRVKDQIDVIRPKFTIPMASQVYFSHQENSYLNREMNTIMDATAWILDKTKSRPIALYPGSTWEVGGGWNNAQELARYEKDYLVVAKHQLRSSESATEDELKSSLQKYVSRLRKANNWALMKLLSLLPFGLFAPVAIRVTDFQKTYRFSPFTGLVPADNAQPDIELSSQSLKFIFDFEWGYDTLAVNGRFRIRTSAGKVAKTFFVGSLNNSGRGVNFRYPIITFLLRRVYWKWVTKIVKPPQGFEAATA
jgi:UDP-MurNAc hydroxylase